MAATTSSNENLDDLEAQLQQAVHDGLVDAGLAMMADDVADDIIQVNRVAVDPDDPDSQKGNRFGFEGKPGEVTELSILVDKEALDPEDNGAITELGFEAGEGDAKRSETGENEID